MDEYNNDLFYPQKPVLEESKESPSWGTTILSLILFIVTFAYFFSDQVSFIAVLVSALIIHELGHFLLMKLFGYKDVSMVFVPLMGAFVNGKKKRYSQWQSLLVVAAGPFPGMIIGFIFLLIYAQYPNEIYFHIALIFLALNSINLFPLDPLDGGQLFRLLVSKQSDLFMLVFSFISSLILIGIGFLLENWFLMGFGFFLAIRVRNMQRRHYIRKIYREKNINYIIDYNDLSNKDFFTMKEVILEDNKFIRKLKDMGDEDQSQIIIANQVNHYLMAPMENDAHFLLKLGIILFWIASFVVPIYYLLVLNPFFIDYGLLFR
jgi:stage IV sporulation protein FB